MINSNVPKTFYLAVYDFEATKNDELSFDVGDFIRVTRKTPGGWWYGHFVYPKDDVSASTGSRKRREIRRRAGWFPINHIVEWKSELNPAQKPMVSQDLLEELRQIGNDEDDIDADETALDAESSTRKALVANLLEMQAHFVQSLRDYVENFAHPLCQQDWFGEREQQIIFGHTDSLLQAHETVRAGLEACVDDAYDEVGEAFAAVMDDIRKPYVILARNHHQSVNLVMEYANNVRMQQFLSETISPVQPPILHLVAWQTRPIQHLDQLVSSLQGLLNATPEWHPAHFSSSSALNLVSTLLASTRRIMKREEDLARLKALTPLIEGWDGPGLEEWGDYIMHTPDCHVISSLPPPPNAPVEYSTWFNDPSRQLYLLSKVLIVLRNSFQGNGMMLLVERIPCVRGVLEIRADDVDGRRFFLDYLGPDMTSKRAMAVTVPSVEKRNEWLANVSKVLKENVRLTLPVIPKELQPQLSGPAKVPTVVEVPASVPLVSPAPQPPLSPGGDKKDKKGLDRLNTLARKLGLAKSFRTVSNVPTPMTRPASSIQTSPTYPSPKDVATSVPIVATEEAVSAPFLKRQSSLVKSVEQPPSPIPSDKEQFPPRMSSMRSSLEAISIHRLETEQRSRQDSLIPESPLSPNFDELIDDLYSYPAWAASNLEEMGPVYTPEEVLECDTMVDALRKRHSALLKELSKLKDEAFHHKSPLMA